MMLLVVVFLFRVVLELLVSNHHCSTTWHLSFTALHLFFWNGPEFSYDSTLPCDSTFPCDSAVSCRRMFFQSPIRLNHTKRLMHMFQAWGSVSLPALRTMTTSAIFRRHKPGSARLLLNVSHPVLSSWSSEFFGLARCGSHRVVQIMMQLIASLHPFCGHVCKGQAGQRGHDRCGDDVGPWT